MPPTRGEKATHVAEFSTVSGTAFTCHSFFIGCWPIAQVKIKHFKVRDHVALRLVSGQVVKLIITGHSGIVLRGAVSVLWNSTG